MKSKPTFWIAIFVLLFLLSMDFWAWGNTVVLSVANLPSWLYYFVVLQLLLTVAIYGFSKYFWIEE